MKTPTSKARAALAARLGILLIALAAVGCKISRAVPRALEPRAVPTDLPVSTSTIAPQSATASATPSSTRSATASPTRTAVPTKTSTPTGTPTPRPTKTPRPARPITKIGPEISRGTHVVVGKPRVIKLRNVDRDYVNEVRRAVGPECLIVVRFDFDEADRRIDPRQAARDWFGRRRDEMLAMKARGGPNIAFETGVNECVDEELDWYVPYSLELLAKMHAEALRSVVGNPAVGHWSEKNWPKYRPVIAALRADDFVGLHEYWVDTEDIANRWHCGRWTIPEIAAVLGNAKLVITECGRDRVENRGEAGWKRTCDIETFLWDLETYDILLNQYPNVVGATAFTLDPNWGDFDLFDLWPSVVFRYSLTPTPPHPAPSATRN